MWRVSVVHHWRPLGRESPRVRPDREGLVVTPLASWCEGLRRGQQTCVGTGQEIPVLGGQHQQLGSDLGQAQTSSPEEVLARCGGEELREKVGDTQGQHTRLLGGQGQARVNISRDYVWW